MRGEELAKGWLLALVEDAPLEEAAAILAGDVARDGPRVCVAVVRALGDEADLRRLEQEGALEPLASRVGELAAASSAEAAAQAVRALQEVVWAALRAELVQSDPDVLVEASERLSLVAALVLAAVLRRRDEVEGEATTAGPARVAPLRVARPGQGSVRPGLEETGGAAGAAGEPRTGGVPEAGGVGDGQDQEAATASTYGATGRGPEQSRDALWIGALKDEIVRAARASLPLSLLLVELDEAERMAQVEPHAETSATFSRFAQAVRTAVRRRDVLACETDSRAWIIARDTGRAGAQALGSRIVTSVPGEESWRGAPLTVSVGLAVLGEDGHNADAMIDAAEQMRFAAEASGIGIVANDEDDFDDPEPSGFDPGLAG